MKILNPNVRIDLEAKRGLKLNLGSGLNHRPGYYSFDCLPLPGVDILSDLNEPLCELPDNSVEAVYTRHTLEHLPRFVELMAELHRVMRPDGRLEIIVPHFSNPYAFSDPTHVRFFGLYSFFYFCEYSEQPKRKVPNFYLPQRFRVQRVKFNLLKASVLDKVIRSVLQPLVNRGPAWLDWYERRLCRWLPVDDIQFVLQPVKPAEDAGVLNSNQKAA